MSGHANMWRSRAAGRSDAKAAALTPHWAGGHHSMAWTQAVRRHQESSRPLLEPVDDLPARRLPHTLVRVDVAEHVVEVDNPPRLSHDPRVEVEDHDAAVRGAVGIHAVEPAAPRAGQLGDGPAGVNVGVVVVKRRAYAE